MSSENVELISIPSVAPLICPVCNQSTEVLRDPAVIGTSLATRGLAICSHCHWSEEQVDYYELFVDLDGEQK